MLPFLRARGRSALSLPLLLASLLSAGALPGMARAETVVERAARTGVITMGGRTDLVPYSFLNERKQVVGYSMDVARLIEAEVSRYLGKPVKMEFVPVQDPAQLFEQVHTGKLDLVCGAQFTWEREMFVDFSIPYSLSGIRILRRQGGPDGSPDSFKGKRIAVVKDSLGQAAIRTYQPGAVQVPVAGLAEGLAELVAGRVDGVAGDSVILASTTHRQGRKDLEMVPAEGYARYAVGCILPENDSTFRNLVNLAIAQMVQGYVNADPASTQLVNRWMGADGILGLPPEVIRMYFEMVLLNHEQIRTPAPGSSAAPSPATAPSSARP